MIIINFEMIRLLLQTPVVEGGVCGKGASVWKELGFAGECGLHSRGSTTWWVSLQITLSLLAGILRLL